MKTTLSTSDIAHALKQDENANWSWAGAQALAEWLEDYEQSTGEEIELDIVSIRCEWSEYSSLESWADEYFRDSQQRDEEIGADDESTEDEIQRMIRDFIEENGDLIEFKGGVIVSSF